jgi:chemotaxis response regulator CheB
MNEASQTRVSGQNAHRGPDGHRRLLVFVWLRSQDLHRDASRVAEGYIREWCRRVHAMDLTPRDPATPRIVGIISSTSGLHALEEVPTRLPPDFPIPMAGAKEAERI